MKKKYSLVLVMIAIAFTGGFALSAQQADAKPKTKTAEPAHAHMFGAGTKENPSRLASGLYHASIGVLWSGAAIDAWGTHNNMTHPQDICGAWVGHATGLVPWCGTEPASNSFHDGDTFVEGGWAKFMGNRNYPGVEGMNTALDVGVMVADRWLYRRGGAWRWAGIALNTWKGIEHVRAGLGNFSFDRPYSSNLSRFMPPGFQGPIWWGTE